VLVQVHPSVCYSQQQRAGEEESQRASMPRQLPPLQIAVVKDQKASHWLFEWLEIREWVWGFYLDGTYYERR
jgi:hypothetical protein